MKKIFIPLLVVALMVVSIFGAVKQKQIDNLNKIVKSAEGVLINGFYTKPSLNYNFSLVEEKPSKENIEALAKELNFTQQLFNSIIIMNEKNINDETRKIFYRSGTPNKCVNYILSLSGKDSLTQKEQENLKQIRESYNTFYKNISNDTSINGINNLDSLALSYVEFVTQIENNISY